MIKTDRLIPMAMLVTAATTFGATFSLNRFAVEEGIPFLPYVFWQAVLGALVLMVLSGVFRRLPRFTWPHLRAYLSIGAFGLAIPYCIFVVAAGKLPSGLVSLGLTLSPILTYLMAMALRMDRFRAIRASGILAGFAGVLLVLVPQASLPAPGMVGWVLFALLGPVCFAITSISADKFRPPDGSALEIGAGVMIVGALLMLPITAGVGDWWFFDRGLSMGAVSVILSGFINALMFVFMQEIVRRAGPVFFSANNFVTTLAGVIWGMLIFGEQHSAYIWGALVLMSFGLYLVSRPPAQAKATR
jgi:drug/metabolite transporter (DMT)-like permease